MNEKYMKIAYNESLKCLKSGDVPVGAVLVMNNKIWRRRKINVLSKMW